MTFWTDLEPRTAQTGAPRLIPGLHLPEFERRLWEYGAAEPATSGFGHWEWPHVVVEIEPGDVVAFHAHLRNCAQGGTPWLSWTIDYLAWPGLGRPDQLAVVRDLLLDDAGSGHEDYHRDRWPSGGTGQPVPPKFHHALSRWNGSAYSASWPGRATACDPGSAGVIG